MCRNMEQYEWFHCKAEFLHLNVFRMHICIIQLAAFTIQKKSMSHDLIIKHIKSTYFVLYILMSEI